MRSISTTGIFVICFAVLFAFFLIRYVRLGTALYGDGIFYWSYVRSVVKDRDLDLRNELNRPYNRQSNNSPIERTYSKYIFNWFPVGTSLAWLPVFFGTDVIAGVIHYFDRSFVHNGYADLYQLSVGIENILFVVIGLYCLCIVLRSYFSRTIALTTVLLVLFASNLVYYGGFDVLNSHPISFVLSVLFFFVWSKSRAQRSIGQWMFLGILLGLMTMVRTQDVVFGILLMLDFIILPERLSKKVLLVLMTGAVWMITLLPQMFIWNTIFGTYFSSPYLRGGFDFFKPHVREVLFNYDTGLVWFTPLYVLSFLGLLVMRRKYRALAFPSIMIVCFQFYVIASWSGWNQGRSFGIRMMISGLPYFSFGLAAILERLKRKLPFSWFVFPLLLVIYNIGSLLFFYLIVH